MMKEKANKQFQAISAIDIKKFLSKSNPQQFEKIIISDDEKVKRCNYVFINYKYQRIDRQAKIVRFPFYPVIQRIFSFLEERKAQFGQQSDTVLEEILRILKNDFRITPENFNVNERVFDFPLDVSSINGENKIMDLQYSRYVPEQTYHSFCQHCSGEKYIRCLDETCKGRHEWTCSECKGKGEVRCEKCKGDKKERCRKCNKSGFVQCDTCFGSGNNGDKKCQNCRGRGKMRCPKCMGKGEVDCSVCNGFGKIECIKCDTTGKITCSHCYADVQRRGKIDCPQCDAQGKVAQIVFVQTTVNTANEEKVIVKNNSLGVSADIIRNHIPKVYQLEKYFININNDIRVSYDQYSKEYTDVFRREIGLHKDRFPLVTQEEVYYQIVPCVRVNYIHILTNEMHQLTIVDFFENPEIILEDDPEKVKQSVGNIIKTTQNLFGRLFNTKKFKNRDDKFKEVVLLIYLAKVDQKIVEEEKTYFTEIIGGISDFTNKQRKRLFHLLNTPVLPELTERDFTFSSEEKIKEVLERLNYLANVDRDLAPKEKEFLDEVEKQLKCKK
ncbi:hypothetical protein [Capnocytophaga cynodegmi]|uniref:hypothetical protein n=1 Tax=Capnocytophaga cynodegmi TaxID=28189 RepID=UPI001EE25A6C|nr:hypothetical protein [Capnocytophaga cynodegmi]